MRTRKNSVASIPIWNCEWKRWDWLRQQDRAKLEQRLLAAVSDLQLAQKERDDYRDQMLRLNEARVVLFENVAGRRCEARMDLEAQLRSINTLITKSTGAPDQLSPACGWERDQREGRVVVCSRQPWWKTGREDRMPMRVMQMIEGSRRCE